MGVLVARRLRILHTADWHLGHSLHGLPRDAEHARFLAWLLELIAAERVDALIVAGDVFDSACPPVRAERAFYDFLAAARRRFPGLDVVVVGGNHDSPVRLEAPATLLRGLNVHVVGALRRRGGEALDWERLLVPLHDAAGEVAAWVCAVPFLRPLDLPALGERAGSLIEGVTLVYGQVLAEARRRRAPGQALLATAHCFLASGILSEDSERKIQRGNQEALPASIFPADVAYVALGHLHRAQAVGGEHLRYSGSPIPLSLSETDYRHEVRIVELEGERFVGSVGHRVPRSVDMLRVPAEGPGAPEVVLAALEGLPAADAALGIPPFLEVRIRVERPEPGLRRQVEEAVAGKQARLVKLALSVNAPGEALADARAGTELRELDPREVFRRCYRRRHEGEPPGPLLEAFEQLLAEVSGQPALAEPTSAQAAQARAAVTADEAA